MSARWKCWIAVGAATVGSVFVGAGNASAAATVCDQGSSAIYSSGAYADTGTLWSCSTPLYATPAFSVSYDYCFLANTNGWDATITTYGVVSGVSVPIDTFTFTTPHNSSGTTCSSWSGRSFLVPNLGYTSLWWAYKNGDWRIGIKYIYVSTWP